MSSILTEGFSYFSTDYFSFIKKPTEPETIGPEMIKIISEKDPNQEAFASLKECLDKAKTEILESMQEYLKIFKKETGYSANYESTLGKIKLAKIELDMAARIVKHLVQIKEEAYRISPHRKNYTRES